MTVEIRGKLYEGKAKIVYATDSPKLIVQLFNDDHVRLLGLATPPELRWIRRTALRVNGVLRPHLARRRLRLVDFKLEFGRAGRRLVLGDEISPDTCRLWDARTRERLDKDRFRRDLGAVEEAYQEVYRRLVGAGGPGR